MEPYKVTEDTLVDPFQSLFEQRVYRRIIERGFKVFPQHKVGAYAIDLVIDGIGGQLAVECDGDFWHGPERFDQDVFRQRQLERCNWKFWRVRESAFNRDPDEAMGGLWRLLEDKGIKPFADTTITSSFSSLIINEGSSDLVPGDCEVEDFEDAQSKTETPDPGDWEEHFDFDEPYTVWSGEPLPDPRVCETKAVAEGLRAIAAVEGPMTVDLLFRRYVRSVGVGRMGNQIESALIKALGKATKSGAIEKRVEWGLGKRASVVVVRVAGTPEVRLRPAGSRSIQEIPPSEIGCLMERLSAEHRCEDKELSRRVLVAYGMKRMTSSVQQLLQYTKTNWVKTSRPQSEKVQPVHSYTEAIREES